MGVKQYDRCKHPGGTRTPLATQWLREMMRSCPRTSRCRTAAGKRGKYCRYRRAASGRRCTKDVTMRRFSMVDDTTPGTCLHGHGRDAGGLDEEVEDLAHRPRLTGTEIVDLARLTALQQSPVAPDDVPHVAEIAPRLQVADVDDGWPTPGLDLDHLPGE